jgi:chitin disaccharide deacetylase
MYYIINADDFGADSKINKAIINCFINNYCSSTTIMANGHAFDEAIELAYNANMNKYIGIHINLSSGIPLTEPIRKMKKFCTDEGIFNNYNLSKINMLLMVSEKEAVAREIRAQIEKCNKSNLYLTHADSHHHIHTRWEIGSIFIPILKEYNINSIRPSRNCGKGIQLVKKIYKGMYNNLVLKRFKTVNFFGSAEDIYYLKSTKDFKKNIYAEVMIHPSYYDKVIVDLNKKPIIEVIDYIPNSKIISYLEFNNIANKK